MSSCTLHIYTNRKCGCQLKKKEDDEEAQEEWRKRRKRQAEAHAKLCHVLVAAIVADPSAAVPTHDGAASLSLMLLLLFLLLPLFAAVAPSAAAAPVLCAAIKTVAGDRPRASFTTALSALLPLLLLLLLPALGLVVQLLRQHLHMHVFVCAMLVAIPQT